MRGLFDTPTLGPCTITPHPYQDESVDGVRRLFKAGYQRVLLSLCTAAGKTIIAALIIRMAIEKGSRVLFLAHTDELIQQTADKLDMAGVEPGIEQGGQFARSMFDPDVVVGSVMTMMRPERLNSWPEDYFDIVFIDEGHRSLAPVYKRIMAHFNKARVIVMTATPVRTDGQAIDYVCEALAYKFSVIDAWKAGKRDGRQYICDLKIVTPELGVNLSDLKRKKSDLTDRHFDDRVGPLMDIVCNKVREHIGDRQTIAFLGSIRAAQLMGAAMSNPPPKGFGMRADAVWGSDDHRHHKIGLYRSGDLQLLANQNLLVEGWDVPATAAVVLGRNTNSWSMMLQQIGRGLRAGKPYCLVLDLNSLTERFGDGTKHGFLLQPTDILGETGFDDEIDELKRILAEVQQKDPELTLMNAVEQAEEEQVRRRKKRYAVRIAIAERQVECPEESYFVQDIVEGDGDPGPARPMVTAPQSDFKPASDGQKRYLRFLGFGDEVERWSRGRAGTAISYAKRQREAGKSHIWQRTRLARKGVEMEAARDMSKEQADAALLDVWEGRREEVYGRRASR